MHDFRINAELGMEPKDTTVLREVLKIVWALGGLCLCSRPTGRSDHTSFVKSGAKHRLGHVKGPDTPVEAVCSTQELVPMRIVRAPERY